MAQAKVLVDLAYGLNEKYRVELKVYEIEASSKHPEGVKVSFILIDDEKRVPRLLVDNHAPFGFHMHTELPEDKDVRVQLPVNNYEDALQEFLQEVERIVKDEN